MTKLLSRHAMEMAEKLFKERDILSSAITALDAKKATRAEIRLDGMAPMAMIIVALEPCDLDDIRAIIKAKLDRVDQRLQTQGFKP